MKKETNDKIEARRAIGTGLSRCPVQIFLDVMGSKWRILILRDLFSGTKRFGELLRSVGCSQKVLTDNLKDLCEKGIVSREAFPTIPPRVEYSLTELGRTLRPVLKAVAKWGEFYRGLSGGAAE